ncbi:hypothetical protein Zmor_017732 [Zophobas morio]|uniref:Uncharacterized protein n=1 Tax=Zophobas morio TaxID=2755281 RepID=A0AA38MCX9_9CUCU|nr:hypothetical protein Zmor_017732 [Zophobas morio]
MGDILVWESILISIKKGENGIDSSQEEILLDVMKTSKLIRIELVHVEGTINKQRYVEFINIEDITYPTASSITLELQDDEYVTFVFPNPPPKRILRKL